MGASNSAFTDQQLEEYQQLTYFTKKEILHVYKRFVVNAGKQNDPTFTVEEKIPRDRVLQLEELRVRGVGS